MGFGKFMRSHDAFGYAIPFSFDKNGGTRGTTFGGFLTMLVEILCLIILYINFSKLINYENDSINERLDEIDFSTVGKDNTTNFKDANFMPVI